MSHAGAVEDRAWALGGEGVPNRVARLQLHRPPRDPGGRRWRWPTRPVPADDRTFSGEERQEVPADEPGGAGDQRHGHQ